MVVNIWLSICTVKVIFGHSIILRVWFFFLGDIFSLMSSALCHIALECGYRLTREAFCL